MKIRTPSGHDVLTVFLCAALILTVCLHILCPSEPPRSVHAAVMLYTDRRVGDFSVEDTPLACGIYKSFVAGISDKRILLICEGCVKDGAFLLSGTKYVLENQPLSITGDGAFASGRAEKVIILDA